METGTDVRPLYTKYYGQYFEPLELIELIAIGEVEGVLLQARYSSKWRDKPMPTVYVKDELGRCKGDKVGTT